MQKSLKLPLLVAPSVNSRPAAHRRCRSGCTGGTGYEAQMRQGIPSNPRFSGCLIRHAPGALTYQSSLTFGTGFPSFICRCSGGWDQAGSIEARCADWHNPGQRLPAFHALAFGAKHSQVDNDDAGVSGAIALVPARLIYRLGWAYPEARTINSCCSDWRLRRRQVFPSPFLML
jgi:hypothetical protein